MFIKKTLQLEEDRIFGLKLITGEEVICTVRSISDTEIVVHTPMQLVSTPDGFAWSPILHMVDKHTDPVIARDSIVIYFTVNTEIIESYQTAISDIILPANNIKLL